MTDNFQWPPLESDPEIFNEYMTKLGMSEQFGFGELYGFDDEMLAMVPQPVYAVILNAERLLVNNQ
jgi:ubiquitin carboxyl-terminal hydrolase L3